MIDFPQDFFKEEYRDGYLVSEMMKRTWAAQMKMLDTLQTFFAEHDLTYWAEVGTLLGTARHKGYVPWDDDIDISMPRADYMRFLRLEDQLPDGLGIRSFYNTDSFSSYHAVVAHKADTLTWDEKRMSENFGCPFIIFIDVFPLDYMPEDPEQYKTQKQLYYFSYKTAFDCLTLEENLFSGKLIKIGDLKTVSDESVNSFMKDLQKLEGYYRAMLGKELLIDPDRSLRNQLYLATDYIGQICRAEDADAIDYAANLAVRPTWKDRPRHLEWYRDTVELDFEITKIKAPVGYLDYLPNEYGKDFMTPKRFISSHDYPFFREEIRVLIGGDAGEIYSIRNSEQYFLDTIQSFWDAHLLIWQYTGATDGKLFFPDKNMYNPESALGLLGSLQDNAVTLGEALEGMFEEGTQAVSKLEKYCEGVYELYNMITADADKKALFDKGMELNLILTEALHIIYKDTHPRSASPVPLYLEKRITDSEGNRKKCVLYGISAADVINNGSLGIKHIRDYLEGIRKSEDTVLFLFTAKGTAEFMERCNLSTKDDYIRLTEEMKTMDFVIYQDEPTQQDVERALCLCDKYYGDKCRLWDVSLMAGLVIEDQIYQPIEES